MFLPYIQVYVWEDTDDDADVVGVCNLSGVANPELPSSTACLIGCHLGRHWTAQLSAASAPLLIWSLSCLQISKYRTYEGHREDIMHMASCPERQVGGHKCVTGPLCGLCGSHQCL
jgi:hypothetical protein